MIPTLAQIQEARHLIGTAVYRSPCPYSLSLSRLCGCEVFCKLEHLQMTGSFKERGARLKLQSLNDEQRRVGVVAASAGNHALGLAYHGQLLSIPVTVVMPRWAPLVKVVNCRGFGAEVILHGESFDEAYQRAQVLAKERGLLFVPGFDDPVIMAGAGTIGLEILEDVPDVDVVVIPVGGGGLIAGAGTAIKGLRPQVRVIGVEPSHAPTLVQSMAAGKVVRVGIQPTLADGLAVAQAGTQCLEAARGVIDQLVLVQEDSLAKAVLRLLELEKMVIEGAGAAPLAALLDGGLKLAGQKVVLLLSGGNIDVTVIARIIERGLAADGRLARFVTRVSDRPGNLARLLAVIAQAGGSIKEVLHDRNFGPTDVAMVQISCIVETRDAGHIVQIHDALTAAGIECHE